MVQVLVLVGGQRYLCGDLGELFDGDRLGFVSRTGLRSRIEHLCPSSIETYRRGKFFSCHGRVVIGVDVGGRILSQQLA